MEAPDPPLSRRSFVRRLILGPAALLTGCEAGSLVPWTLTRPRRRPAPLGPEGERSLVVVVEGRDLGAMLRAGLGAIPGLRDALGGARRIVLKPNATTAEPYPVTTDPLLLRELVGFIRRLSDGRITVVDGPSYAGLAARRVFGRLGYLRLAGPGVAVRWLDPTVGSHFVRVGAREWEVFPEILTAGLGQEADLVVTVAVPKRHHAAEFSGGLKNLMGLTYDAFRMRAHWELARGGEEGRHRFDRAIAEFADAVRPDLTVIDAGSLLARHGPGLVPGRSEVVPGVNRLLVSPDPVAADAWAADLLAAHDPTFPREGRVEGQLAHAEALGLGRRDPWRVVELAP